ncbi:SH2 domain-containing protein 1B isoform X3 [Denticeps clupeoides]|uniref:SH2 domain-containing protein n=1 Tax=Denticeps clupeoides TaxID=299321 RepID=A0AAY4A936_9TELE|nr:SH2 domain-containing protein 1B-like isoform X3 [Denticeps clupeoides]XP_028826323.1 SH2 domain-containing protein 1B-like isoform X3 [Denticeps clupeoides]XP_028826324.1 SH2 domain-containing protein 1B-like isoform X3 [Denticeps clupeoides]
MDHPVYHGPISRTRCEELLAKKGMDGSYLIRDSETIQGAMCLCVFKQKIVYTYRILQTHTGHYTLQTSAGVEEKFFKSLEDMIKHYNKRNKGLVVHLRHAVKRKVIPEHPPIPNEEVDYEDVESSEYVEVLPS